MTRGLCWQKNAQGIECDQPAAHPGDHQGSAWGQRYRWGRRPIEARADGDRVVLSRAKVTGVTDKALKVLVGGETIWFPRAQVIEEPDGEGDLVVTRWIAKEKGLA